MKKAKGVNLKLRNNEYVNVLINKKVLKQNEENIK